MELDSFGVFPIYEEIFELEFELSSPHLKSNEYHPSISLQERTNLERLHQAQADITQ